MRADQKFFSLDRSTRWSWMPGFAGFNWRVEGGRLRRLLLLRRQLREAVGERVRDAELHQSTRNTFITSSPRWLMTFTAMRPDSGLSNGREMPLCSVSHASSLISALSVVFSDL